MKTYEINDTINEFIDYVNEFYNKETGIYPIATKLEIINGIEKYFDEHVLTGKVIFTGDSLDRERVREILQPSYSLI